MTNGRFCKLSNSAASHMDKVVRVANLNAPRGLAPIGLSEMAGCVASLQLSSLAVYRALAGKCDFQIGETTGAICN